MSFHKSNYFKFQVVSTSQFALTFTSLAIIHGFFRLEMEQIVAGIPFAVIVYIINKLQAIFSWLEIFKMKCGIIHYSFLAVNSFLVVNELQKIIILFLRQGNL